MPIYIVVFELRVRIEFGTKEICIARNSQICLYYFFVTLIKLLDWFVCIFVGNVKVVKCLFSSLSVSAKPEAKIGNFPIEVNGPPLSAKVCTAYLWYLYFETLFKTRNYPSFTKAPELSEFHSVFSNFTIFATITKFTIEKR